MPQGRKQRRPLRERRPADETAGGLPALLGDVGRHTGGVLEVIGNMGTETLNLIPQGFRAFEVASGRMDPTKQDAASYIRSAPSPFPTMANDPHLFTAAGKQKMQSMGEAIGRVIESPGGQWALQAESDLEEYVNERFGKEFGGAVFSIMAAGIEMAGGKGAKPRLGNVKSLNRADFIYDMNAPAEMPNSQRLVDVGDSLQRDALEAWGGKEMDLTPENLPVLVDNLTAEAMASYAARPDMAGWYKANLTEAIENAARIHPELATDPKAQTAFKVIKAITSNGQEVPLNARLTNDYYSHWKSTGKFPEAGSGKEQGAMKSSFAAANAMIDDVGFDGFTDFINTDFTVRELTEHGFRISGENLDTTVKGSVIFGPKIGGGFLQNLLGNYDPPTFDRWFMRTFGRHTGTLLAKPEKVAKQQTAFRAAVGRKRKLITDLGMDPDEVLNSPDGLNKLAKKIHQQFAKGGYKDKTPVNNAARNLDKSLSNLVDSPSGGKQREYMRQAMLQIRDNMRTQGVDVDVADVQALLWYAEKDLYGKMGARVNTETVDYATVWRRLADDHFARR